MTEILFEGSFLDAALDDLAEMLAEKFEREVLKEEEEK